MLVSRRSWARDAARGATLLMALLAPLAVVGCTPLSAPLTEPPTPASTDDRPFRLALSVSPYTRFMVDDLGIVFDDGERTADDSRSLTQLYAAHGATEIYARSTTRLERNPNGVADHSFLRAIDLGLLAKQEGLDFNLELGLFRTYGDLLCQTPPDFSDFDEITVPGEWHTLTLEQMESVLVAYGTAVATRLEDAGVEVATWNIGNEIDYGFAGVSMPPLGDACAGDEGATGWYRAPDAVNPAIGELSYQVLAKMPEADRIAWLEEELWPYTAVLFAAVQDGIRAVASDARFSTHLSGAATEAFALGFYDVWDAAGIHLDELGLSYYPSSSRETIAAFKSRATSMIARYGTPVFIAEYAYAAGDVDDAGPFGTWDQQVGPYEVTPVGSARFARDLTAWAAANGVSGIRPWAPDLGPAPIWGPLGLFEETGQARPGLFAFQDGLLHGDPALFSDRAT